ncbi:MAG TPA: O-methyltransferase [Gemmatimonadaceae bacterium]|nr:O-methyltransferase [Gemmatimonadaceae bacterium]
MDNVSQYIVSLFAAEDRLLAALREEADRTGMPPAAVSADTGRLLQVLIRTLGARRVLEVGTLGGYAAIWMGRALPPDGTLLTIEREDAYVAFAERYIEQAGLARVVSVRRGRAVDVLPSLDGEEFDLIFLDADRASLPTYLDWALRLVRRGGLIVADNTLCGGRVIEGPADDGDVRAVREFNQRVASDPRLTSILIPAYDGLVVALAEGR